MAPETRLELSERRVAEILDLRFALFEKAIAEHFITEKRAREIARDEFSLVARQQWDLRSKLAAVGVFFLSVSTFIYAVVFHHGQ